MSSLRGGFRNVARGATGKSSSPGVQRFWSILMWLAIAAAAAFFAHRRGWF